MIPVWLALIAMVPMAVTPFVVAWLTGRQKRAETDAATAARAAEAKAVIEARAVEKAADYARQDLVAARVQEAADKAAEAAEEVRGVAAKAAEAADLLLARQDKAEMERADVALERAETARVLAENNAAVAKVAAETQGQLVAIHGLVNAKMTETLQEVLNEKIDMVSEMKRTAAMTHAAGRPEDMAHTEKRLLKEKQIAELRVVLRDRLAATKAAEAAVAHSFA